MARKAMRKTVNYYWLRENEACVPGLKKFHRSFRKRDVDILELIPWIMGNIDLLGSIVWLLRSLQEEDKRWGDYVFRTGDYVFYCERYEHYFEYSHINYYNSIQASNDVGGLPKM